MGLYCEHCGAKLNENAKFCHECGNSINSNSIKDKINQCPECGRKLDKSKQHCEHCGAKLNILNNQSKDHENFISKYKIPLIIIIFASIIILSLFIISSLYTEPSPNIQVVEVETFQLPSDFKLDPSSRHMENDNGVITSSKMWTDGKDYIGIIVIHSGYRVDLDAAAANIGGVKKTLMGYEGYYLENNTIYSFAFPLNGKLCIIAVSNPQLFNEIKVL